MLSFGNRRLVERRLKEKFRTDTIKKLKDKFKGEIPEYKIIKQVNKYMENEYELPKNLLGIIDYL